jgi:acetylglutamate kinase
MMEHAAAKAAVLLEALPYIRHFSGQTVVIKYGGHAMKDEALRQSFAQTIVLLRYIGVHPVVVHGGGPQIGQMLGRLGIESQFRQGLRVTDDATMDVVEMVLVGKVNKEIVSLINLAGGRAVGLSGKDGQLIRAQKLEMAVERDDAPPEILDLGKVGEVVGVEAGLLRSLLEGGFIPVVAPVGVDPSGETYNINADAVAGAVAVAMGAKKLILLTDVPGVLDADGQLISSMTRRQAVEVVSSGVARGGMIPKITCCLEALEFGVEKAHIVDGRVPNVVLLEMFTEAGVGTEIVA